MLGKRIIFRAVFIHKLYIGQGLLPALRNGTFLMQSEYSKHNQTTPRSQ